MISRRRYQSIILIALRAGGIVQFLVNIVTISNNIILRGVLSWHY